MSAMNSLPFSGTVELESLAQQAEEEGGGEIEGHLFECQAQREKKRAEKSDNDIDNVQITAHSNPNNLHRSPNTPYVNLSNPHNNPISKPIKLLWRTVNYC